MKILILNKHKKIGHKFVFATYENTNNFLKKWDK